MVRSNDGYVFYKWNENNGNGYYSVYEPNGVPVTVITTQEYYDSSDLETKNNYISLLNNVIELRKAFVLIVKNAFFMRNGSGYTLEVKAITNEVPVKTLIYCMHDTEDGNSESFGQLDENKVENECYGITVPTLTGLVSYGDDFIWRGNDSSDLRFLGDMYIQPLISGFKKPYLVAIQNALEETLPESIPGGIEGDINEVSEHMFGVHMIDKRLRFRYNNWVMAYNWPNYREGNDSGGSMSGTNIPKTISVPGLFAGFVLDGEPEYSNGYYPDTYFERQTLDGTTFNLNTLTVENGGYNVEEWRYPVVRLVTSNEEDRLVYTDYKYADNTIDSMFNVIGLEKLTHMVYTNKYAEVVVQDKNTISSVSLYDEVSTPSVSYNYTTDNDGESYIVEAMFAETGYYTFYDGLNNPVYAKANGGGVTCMNFSSAYDVMAGTGKMDFDDTNFTLTRTAYSRLYQISNTPVWEVYVSGNYFKKICHSITISGYNCMPMTTVYAVRVSNDKQVRTISKTFDLTPMEYYVKIVPDIIFPTEYVYTNQEHSVILYVNVGIRKEQSPSYLEEGFYYLKEHNFSVDFLNNGENGEVSVIKHVDIENGYGNNDFVDVDTNGITKWIEIPIENFGASSSTSVILDLCSQLNQTNAEGYAYLTDVTGLRHDMKFYNSANNGFNKSYVLLNG